jgi:hypothetical protein
LVSHGEISLPWPGLEKPLAWLAIDPYLAGLFDLFTLSIASSLPWVLPSVLLSTMSGHTGSLATYIITFAMGDWLDATLPIFINGQPLDGLAVYAGILDLLGFLGDAGHCSNGLNNALSLVLGNGLMLGPNMTVDLGRNDGKLTPFAYDYLELGQMLKQFLKWVHYGLFRARLVYGSAIWYTTAARHGLRA